MDEKTESGAARIQYDTDGQAIGYLFKADCEHVELVLRPNFRLVLIPETRRLRVWDKKNDKLIELAK